MGIPIFIAITSLTPRAHSALNAGLRYKICAFCSKKQIAEVETLAGLFQTYLIKTLHVFCIIACISAWGSLSPRMFLRAFFRSLWAVADELISEKPEARGGK